MFWKTTSNLVLHLEISVSMTFNPCRQALTWSSSWPPFLVLDSVLHFGKHRHLGGGGAFSQAGGQQAPLPPVLSYYCVREHIVPGQGDNEQFYWGYLYSKLKCSFMSFYSVSQPGPSHHHSPYVIWSLVLYMHTQVCMNLQLWTWPSLSRSRPGWTPWASAFSFSSNPVLFR